MVNENLVEKKVEQVGKKLDKVLDSEKGLKKSEKLEVRKRLGEKFLENSKESARAFGREFKNQTSVAVTAAFGFLIGLSWREPISEAINKVLENFGFGTQMAYKFISAFVVTIIAVFFLVLVSRWSNEKK